MKKIRLLAIAAIAASLTSCGDLTPAEREHLDSTAFTFIDAAAAGQAQKLGPKAPKATSLVSKPVAVQK